MKIEIIILFVAHCVLSYVVAKIAEKIDWS